VLQVERHHLVDAEPEVGAQQVDGYRVPVRVADLLDVIPRWIAKGLRPKSTARSVLRRRSSASTRFANIALFVSYRWLRARDPASHEVRL